MKKFINDVESVLRESLGGLADAHGGVLRVEFEPTFVARASKADAKVALISGGGSGHEPLHAGYVGTGMLDAACPGQVFTSPTPDQMLAAAHAVEAGRGVLFIVKNYAGDTMNFQIASEMLEIENMTVLVNDDVAVENSTHTTGRRGVAGTVMVEKMVGAAAEQGASLAECHAVGQRVNAATASMGVAFTSCTVPAAGRATFDIGDDEMEIGVGIHGEPGRRRVKLAAADEIVDMLAEPILDDGVLSKGDTVLAFVNGLGGTPLLELYVIYRRVAEILAGRGITIGRQLVGSYITSLEMAGTSVTLLKLDDELTRLWDAPVHTPALRWGV